MRHLPGSLISQTVTQQIKAGEQDHWARLLPVRKVGERVPDWCIKVKVS